MRILVVASLAMWPAAYAQTWSQWGQNAQHTGVAPVLGQSPNRILADLVYDPFVPDEQAETGGSLIAHYPSPLIQGRNVFMLFKTGKYTSCNPPGSGRPAPCGREAWASQVWNIKRLAWRRGELVEKWTFESDWKPVPNAVSLGGWEPVFHAALTDRHVWIPGFGGTVIKVKKKNGAEKRRFNPLGDTIDPNAYVAGPITADDAGNIYYNVLKLDPEDPWGGGQRDIPDAWLVKIARNGELSKVSYKTLIPDAPSTCTTRFAGAAPSPTATPAVVPCLSQRPGLNAAPAVAPDGTIYTVTAAHHPQAKRFSYVVAFNSDLTLKWAASLRDRLKDGCGVLVTGCRAGTAPGVDPATNELPAGMVVDQSSSSPVVAPDGSVLYGAQTQYNESRGHLFRFGAAGEFLGSYDFGWDTTPAVRTHDGTFSIILKDNHYVRRDFYIAQLSPDMKVEWQFQNTNDQHCERQPDGSLRCVPSGENGFEWCVNMPALDVAGNVYANNEDGNLYVLDPTGKLIGNLFLQFALGAAYTPVSIGPDGKIYTQNAGHLFVVGN